ncbi:hypothetical protein F2P81_019323 [Scophthalmus maximus]|uniref:Uncharacterized protein n=1 Tax=Scophthalmus maximus TaxID=52904 RepID=A0A6A4RZC3_SCOMX|nr:hypothetical protein F2P81_019323 [Scophthalmus maximus]
MRRTVEANTSMLLHAKRRRLRVSPVQKSPCRVHCPLSSPVISAVHVIRRFASSDKYKCVWEFRFSESVSSCDKPLQTFCTAKIELKKSVLIHIPFHWYR